MSPFSEAQRVNISLNFPSHVPLGSPSQAALAGDSAPREVEEIGRFSLATRGRLSGAVEKASNR